MVDEAYADFCGRHAHAASRAREPRQRGRRPDVCEGLWPCRASHRRARRRSGHARAAPPRRPAVQRQRRASRRRCRRRSRDPAYYDWYLDQVAQSKRLLYDAFDRLASPTGRARRTSCSRASGGLRGASRRGSPRGACTSATGRGDAGCAGCLRITAGVVEHTQRVHRRAGGRPVRRAVDQTGHQGDVDRSAARRSTARGRYDVSTGIRFLDHMLELFARHGGFDLKVRATGDLDVDQHHTVEDLGIALGEAVSRRARQPAAASTARATSSCRWTRRSRSRPSISAGGSTPSSTCA